MEMQPIAFKTQEFSKKKNHLDSKKAFFSYFTLRSTKTYYYGHRNFFFFYIDSRKYKKCNKRKIRKIRKSLSQTEKVPSFHIYIQKQTYIKVKGILLLQSHTTNNHFHIYIEKHEDIILRAPGFLHRLSHKHKVKCSALPR